MSVDVRLPWDFNEQLPDGDVILVEFADVAPPNQVELCLETGSRVTWWKGIMLVNDSDGSYRTIVDIAGQPGARQCGLLIPDDVGPSSGNSLYLSKAKFLGIHDNTYRIANPDILTPATKATFRWLSD